MNKTNPVFVVFEGLDASGKTGISQEVAREIGAEWTSNPSKELWECREIADDLYKHCGRAVQLFYSAANVHLSDMVKERLRTGKSVVMDRYIMSTLAYDKTLRESGLPDSVWIDDVYSGIKIPDIVIYLDVSPKVREQRMNQRGTPDPTDVESLNKFKSVQDRYDKLSSLLGHHKKPWYIVWIKNEGTKEECIEKCLAEIRRLA